MDIPYNSPTLLSFYLCLFHPIYQSYIHDFNDHTHSPDNFSELDFDCFNCNYCDETFGALSEVMHHTKQVHTSNVQHCNKFLEGNCYYGESCWFLHSENHRNSEPELHCSSCESKFRTKTTLMKHMKNYHVELVSKCKHEETKCRYGQDRCWFLHKENIETAYRNVRNSSFRF